MAMEHIDGYVIGERPAGLRRPPWQPEYTAPGTALPSLMRVAALNRSTAATSEPIDIRALDPAWRRIVRRGEDGNA